MNASWTDRDNPTRRNRIRTGDDTYILDNTITVTSFRDYHDQYFTHPETKASGPDNQPCQPNTVGQLRPLTVKAEPVLGRLGKETNRVTAETDLADLDDPPLVYSEKTCRECGSTVRPRLKWCDDRCRKRNGRGQTN